MKGLFFKFKESNSIFSDNLIVKGESFPIIETRLRAFFEKKLKEKNQTITYFNFMEIDSDFVQNHDYDATITIHVSDIDKTDETYSYSMNIDYEIIHKIL